MPAEPNGPPPNPPATPDTVFPPNACDCHCHIFGPFDRFPLPPGRRFTPHETPERMLRDLHDRLGIGRAVIVHSTGHGMDHAPLLDALASGGGRYRGVALLEPDATGPDIRRYHDAGVRGVRFNFLAHLGGQPDLAAMARTIEAVRPFGWHVAVHVAGSDLATHAAFIGAIPLPVVIDHMARPDLSEGLDGPAPTALRRLLDTGRVWVKLSGADRISRQPPPFADAVALARALAAHAPDRALWGTDWPHVNIAGAMPDDAALADLVAEIAPGEAARHAMLVENPARLFGFDPRP